MATISSPTLTPRSLLLTSIWACIPYEFTYTTSYSFLNLHKDTICDLEKRNATRHDNETTATLASCSAKLKRAEEILAGDLAKSQFFSIATRFMTILYLEEVYELILIELEKVS